MGFKMNDENLKNIVYNFEKILKEISILELEDSKVRCKYAEYFVACELAKKGYSVQILNRRDETSADIYLTDIKKKIEVKSGKYDNDGWTDASFGLGKQIKNGKFDYCIFVTFSKSEEGKIEEVFIFTREELEEVANISRKVARFQSTNPCLLLRCRSFAEYKNWIEINNHKQLKIEEELNEHPEKFNKKWDKIK